MLGWHSKAACSWLSCKLTPSAVASSASTILLPEHGMGCEATVAVCTDGRPACSKALVSARGAANCCLQSGMAFPPWWRKSSFQHTRGLDI
jgi:hypothetical protein